MFCLGKNLNYLVLDNVISYLNIKQLLINKISIFNIDNLFSRSWLILFFSQQSFYSFVINQNCFEWISLQLFRLTLIKINFTTL